MGTTEKVRIESKLDGNFKLETKTGNHTVIVDQPLDSGGKDAGPSPLEYLFISLAGCIGTTARIIAHQNKINLRGMSIAVEGEFDYRVIRGKTKEARPGFQSINVTIDLDADISKAEKENIIKEIIARCPVSDNIGNTTPLIFKLKSQ